MVETGTHPELLQQGGLYSEMWSRQKDAASIGKSASSASMSSATTSATAAANAAESASEGAHEGGRRASRGVLGSLVGATQSILGYGGAPSGSDAQSHHHA